MLPLDFQQFLFYPLKVHSGFELNFHRGLLVFILGASEMNVIQLIFEEFLGDKFQISNTKRSK